MKIAIRFQNFIQTIQIIQIIQIAQNIKIYLDNKRIYSYNSICSKIKMALTI